MKILFLGDYSNLHASLAAEMRLRGHEVTHVADGGGIMKTKADIYLRRKPGTFGLASYLAQLIPLLPRLSGYDVVQLINPHFISLRPEKISRVFRQLRKQNGSVFLSLAGNDYYFVKYCAQGRFPFSEYRVGHEPTPFTLRFPEEERSWLSDPCRRLAELVYNEVTGAMSVLPEYDMAARPVLGDRLCFTNIPIDLSQHPFREIDFSKKLNLFVGIKTTSMHSKGALHLYEAARRAASLRPDRIADVIRVQDVSLQEYLKRLSSAHILLDQLYALSPSTNALHSMATGRIAASGSSDDYFRMLGEKPTPVVIPLSPLEDVAETIISAVGNPDALTAMARNARRIVERHNAASIVADKYENHWHKMLSHG